MKTKLSIVFAVLLVAVAAMASDAPFIDAQISSDTTARQILDAKGPLKVKFRVAVTNRSEVPVTLRGVDIRTDDASGFLVRDGRKKLNTVIAPATTETIDLVGKHLAPKGVVQTEPLHVSLRLMFKGPGGEFTKVHSQIIP